ncbi:amidohydrolase family protein [Candidatus Bipolaricaulota bacterium]|nr:amidohydrolase family protein [Candidatus Bipolaricaulota bacterium]
MHKILIRGGRVVSSDDVREADLLVSDGLVARIDRDLDEPADRMIDATGRYVLPGVIDAHTHPVYLDDLESLPVTAAHGGVTTVIHYAYAKPGSGLLETIRRFREEAESVSILDFALHGGLFDPACQSAEIPAAIAEGVTSFKMFMTYAKLGWMTDDYQLMRTFDIIARAGGLGMVHAENGLATDYLQDRGLAVHADSKETFLETRPAILEAEAIHRAIAMAQVAGCVLYIPHMTAALGIEQVAAARAKGFRVYAETCPQYLTLTHEDLLKQGPLLKIGPPLREASDRAALWRAIAEGVIDTVASDHAAKEKRIDDDFFAAPYGSPQVETMLPLVFSEGVATRRIALPCLVRTMCENPARIFGLYPTKGSLQPGSDADLVIFDPKAEWTIAHAEQHSQALYSAYEGRACVGRPVLTMQRGEVLVENGETIARPGRARFLPTTAGRAELSELV